MQSALRSAARRAAGASSRRGVATAATRPTTTTTTTEAEREWVASLVKREVRAQMLAAEERAALARAKEAEWSALLRASKVEREAPWKELDAWSDGFFTAWLSGFAGVMLGNLLVAGLIKR